MNGTALIWSQIHCRQQLDALSGKPVQCDLVRTGRILPVQGK